MMRLRQWDAEVLPHLRTMQAASHFIGQHAIAIVRAVDELRVRPNFETKAEVALINAESQLNAALKSIQEARRRYLAKPAAA